MQQNKEIDAVRKMASRHNFTCEIFHHEQSGKSTEEAVRATGFDSTHIIKCLLLRSKDNQYLGAIVRGSDKINFKVLQNLSGYRDLTMASSEDVKRELGFEIGGVPAVIFSERNIKTYVDNRVLTLDYAIGSGGTQFHGMKFQPKQLTDRLSYLSADIVREIKE